LSKKSPVRKASVYSFTVFLLVFLFCSLSFVVSIASTDDELTRDEIMKIAEAYKNHAWIPSKENICHGNDLDGIWVDTPDRDSYNWPLWKGGWKAGEINIGIPYKWRGFSCIPESEYRGEQDKEYRFDEGIKAKKCAGDKNFVGVSSPEYTVGVDCSGFVSRCWRLSRNYSTRTLPDISQPIKFKDLKRGDILISAGHHVMLFSEFTTPDDKTTPEQTRIRVYEASGKDWKVSEREYLLTSLNEVEKEWQGHKYETDEVTLEIASGPYRGLFDERTYIPRRYFRLSSSG